MQEHPDIWRSRLNSSQIRLVRIDPADDAADLVNCGLETFALESITDKFDAISYTWGGEQRDAYISCDGCPLAVTKSCRDALWAYRSVGRHVVWIDQLCVNQEDLEERSTQVLLMGQIYSRAEQVYIWLGEFGSAHESGSLWRHLDHLGPVAQKSALASLLGDGSSLPFDYTQDYDAIHSLIDELLENSPMTRAQWGSLEDAKVAVHLILNLLERAYHGRRWIIQEICLNRAVSVLLGDVCFPFEILVRLAFAVRPIFSAIEHKRVRQALARPLGQILLGRFWHGTLPWLHLTNIDMISRIRQSLHQDQQLDPIELMVQCSMFRVKEAVDDLYAIRALMNRTSAIAAPTPDYNASVEDVYFDHTTWLFSQGQGLRALSKLPLFFENTHELPTWTVDFSTAFDLMTGETNVGDRVAYRNEIFWEYLSESRTPGLHDDGSSFETDLASFQATLPHGAATMGPPTMEPVISNRRLYLDGYILGAIQDLMLANKARSLRGIVHAHQWYRSILASKQASEVRDRIQSQNTFIESLHYGSHNDSCVAFREKILYNLACRDEPPVVDRRDELIQMPDEPDNPLAAEFVTEYDYEKKEMDMTLLGSVMFACTTQGFPVLVPTMARQGDLVVFFPGVSKPFLLRESSVAGEYSIVGQMHVLSLMWWDERVFDLAPFKETRRLVLV